LPFFAVFCCFLIVFDRFLTVFARLLRVEIDVSRVFAETLMNVKFFTTRKGTEGRRGKWEKG
jgi:hypothetical protein